MSRMLTYVGTAFLLILVGFPAAPVLNAAGFACIAFAGISFVVSAPEVARKAFLAAIGCFALAQVLPVLRSIAWSVAPFAFVCLALGIAAYVVGVRTWKRLMSDRAEGPTKGERPRVRVRADLPPTLELPPMPTPDESPVNLFAGRRRRRP